MIFENIRTAFLPRKVLVCPWDAGKLTNDIMVIDEALEKRTERSLHLGGNVYCKVAENSFCVNIRQYWCPPDQNKGFHEFIDGSIFPTKKGICLRPTEYNKLKEFMKDIGEAVPELNTVVPCYAQSDHLNQLGYLRCAECSPNDTSRV